MDELERRRRERDGEPGEAPVASPEDDLAERADEAEADDDKAQRRDQDARGDDLEAVARDQAAEQRDDAADSRDAAARGQTYPPSQFAERRKARGDREDAASDRARAAEDRDRAGTDRRTSEQQRDRAGDDRGAARVALAQLRELLNRAEDEAEHMVTIGQAQGMIMTAQGCGALEALLELTTRAVRDHSELEAAARAIVREGARD